MLLSDISNLFIYFVAIYVMFLKYWTFEFADKVCSKPWNKSWVNLLHSPINLVKNKEL